MVAMSTTTSKLDLSYPAIKGFFGRHLVKSRTESAALLAWFLDNYYHLEPTEVADAICDRKYDKGIDGIYVNDLTQQIDILSCVIGTATPVQGLGDSDLKDLMGSVTQLSSGDSVRTLAKSVEKKNVELAQLLDRLEIAAKVDDGYTVRPVFVTNKKRDTEAIEYLKLNPSLVLYDGLELEKEYLAPEKVGPIASKIIFDISGVGALRYQSGTDVDMAIAPLLASELVTMDGIASQELFAWNVRYRLRRSPINKAIDVSVQTTKEHQYFPAFHNGLTVLCETLDVDANKTIEISGYAVVNGCQSLSSLYENRAKLTPALRILTKFVKASPGGDLASKITDRTNRQNGISGRDRQSNNVLHTRLQTDIRNRYTGSVYYRVARGEGSDWDASKVIDNEQIARVLLAFDLRQPESCHQTYKLFEDFHSNIFGRKEVNADRLVALFDIDKVIQAELPTMSHDLFADYSLTRYLFHFLTREALDTDITGKELVQNPSIFLAEKNGRRRLTIAITPVVSALIRLTDAELKRREDAEPPEIFDYKKDLKSKGKVGELRSRVIPGYQMAIDAKMAKPFSDLWSESA